MRRAGCSGVPAVFPAPSRPQAHRCSSSLGRRREPADATAFAALLHPVALLDARRQTVRMVQVEHEVGYLGLRGPVPYRRDCCGCSGRAGEYPSGRPYPRCQPIYRAGAPAITFYAPDIYWPDFAHGVQRDRRAGNPVFVAESPPGLAAEHARYVFRQARGLGCAAFGVDSPLFAPDRAEARLAAVYRLFAALGRALTAAQERDQIRALALRRTSPSPTQTVALGGSLFTARLARDWFAHRLLERSGALLILRRAPNVFDVLGRGLALTVRRDPNVAEGLAGIADIAPLHRHAGRWIVAKRLNGDQSNQRRTLLLSPQAFHFYRMHLHSIPRS